MRAPIRVPRLAVAILCVLAAACSSPAAQRRTDAAQEPDVNVAPTPIDGTYAAGEYILRLEGGRWSMNFPARDGLFRVSEDELILSNEEGCPGQGTYAWTLENDELVLNKVEELCALRDVRFPSMQKWFVVKTLDEQLGSGDKLMLADGQHVANYLGEEDVTGRSEVTLKVSTTSRKGLVFSPTVLIGSPGQSITLTIQNPDGKGTENSQHNFNIDELGISQLEVPYGDAQTVSVEFPTSGGLRFYCAYHARFGQQGELLVA